MARDEEKITQIKSLDPSNPDISAQRGLCRFIPGEDPVLRRAKEEKVAEALQTRHGHTSIDGFIPAHRVDGDGEYIATRNEGTIQLHCVVWRDGGLWRRLSDWSEQMPESSLPHAEILFAPNPDQYPDQPAV